MESRWYQGDGLSLERLAYELTSIMQMQKCTAYFGGNSSQMMMQCRKEGELQSLLGLQAALTVTMQQLPTGIIAVIGQQQWIDQTGVDPGQIPVLWPLECPIHVGKMLSPVLQILDKLVQRQVSSVQINIAPDALLQQAQRIVQSLFQPHEQHTPVTDSWLLQDIVPQSTPAHASYASSLERQAILELADRPTLKVPQLESSAPPRAEREQMELSIIQSEPAWGQLVFAERQRIELTGASQIIGRTNHEKVQGKPDINLAMMAGAKMVSRHHARIEHLGKMYLLTDLKSVNLTKVNGKTLVPEQPTLVFDGDALEFGLVRCVFKANSAS